MLKAIAATTNASTSKVMRSRTRNAPARGIGRASVTRVLPSTAPCAVVAAGGKSPDAHARAQRQQDPLRGARPWLSDPAVRTGIPELADRALAHEPGEARRAAGLPRSGANPYAAFPVDRPRRAQCGPIARQRGSARRLAQLRRGCGRAA